MHFQPCFNHERLPEVMRKESSQAKPTAISDRLTTTAWIPRSSLGSL